MAEQTIESTTVDNTEVSGTGSDETGNDISTQAKTFTQDELNEIVAKRVQKVKSTYEGINPSEYKELLSLKDQVEDESLIKRQEFDKLLKKHKTKADDEIAGLRGELERIKIDGALIDAASKLKSVAPEQTAKLLREQVKLDADGKVVILDGGDIRYNDDAEPMTVDQLVDEFLTSNTYFRAAGPTGTDSQSNAGVQDNKEVSLADLDLNNPAHREIYKKWKMEGKV